MKREFKILLIVFGSIAALFVIAVVAAVVILARVGPELARNATDPVAAKRTAAKIATFDVPKGYRIASATDFQISRVVRIESQTPGGNGFHIELQGTMYGAGEGQLTGARAGMSVVGRLRNCNLQDAGSEDVRVRGVDVKLAIMQCPGARTPMRIETGVFPGNDMQVTLSAIGIRANAFDESALHELLRSVR